MCSVCMYINTYYSTFIITTTYISLLKRKNIIMELVSLSLCVILFTTFIYFIASSHSNNGKKVPRGSFGWPFLGETYDFLFSDPHKFMEQRMKKYSHKIFTTHLYGYPTVVLCGVSGHKFIAANEGKLMTAWRTTAMQKLFRGTIYTCMIYIYTQRERETHTLIWFTLLTFKQG